MNSFSLRMTSETKEDFFKGAINRAQSFANNKKYRKLDDLITEQQKYNHQFDVFINQIGDVINLQTDDSYNMIMALLSIGYILYVNKDQLKFATKLSLDNSDDVALKKCLPYCKLNLLEELYNELHFQHKYVEISRLISTIDKLYDLPNMYIDFKQFSMEFLYSSFVAAYINKNIEFATILMTSSRSTCKKKYFLHVCEREDLVWITALIQFASHNIIIREALGVAHQKDNLDIFLLLINQKNWTVTQLNMFAQTCIDHDSKRIFEHVLKLCTESWDNCYIFESACSACKKDKKKIFVFLLNFNEIIKSKFLSFFEIACLNNSYNVFMHLLLTHYTFFQTHRFDFSLYENSRMKSILKTITQEKTLDMFIDEHKLLRE